MGARIRVTEPDKLALLYERFRDVCLVEKEIWKEIFMPRDVTAGPVRTNVQDRYEVEIDDQKIEASCDDGSVLQPVQTGRPGISENSIPPLRGTDSARSNIGRAGACLIP